MSAVFPAHRFDGRYAVAIPVCVRVEAGQLIVEGLDASPLDREPLAHARVFDPCDNAPRLIVLRSGATLEVSDGDRSFARELERAGLRPSWAVRLQARWLAAVFAVAAIIALSVAAYREGVPRVTNWAAFALPKSLEERLGRGILELLDENTFKASQLSRDRQAEIADAFARTVAQAAPGVDYTLEFRRTAGEMVNAFTLPGGIIVLLDATVAFGDDIDDDAVLGVLGHELGHVVHKHGTRNILRSLGIGALGSLLWGDFSGAAATVPVMLGQMSYSRDFESEADDFAARALQARTGSAKGLYLFFACLEERPEARFALVPEFLSSHPPTDARLARIKAFGAEPGEGPVCPSKKDER